jgi:hypothetical protein
LTVVVSQKNKKRVFFFFRLKKFFSKNLSPEFFFFFKYFEDFFSRFFTNNTFCPIFQVKACAIQRIRDGETKVQVARDLQCPISTVSSWWHRRTSIVPELASEVNSDSAVSSVSQKIF